jgi:hypothetical protein
MLTRVARLNVFVPNDWYKAADTVPCVYLLFAAGARLPAASYLHLVRCSS